MQYPIELTPERSKKQELIVKGPDVYLYNTIKNSIKINESIVKS
jgi:hypothetical protein